MLISWTSSNRCLDGVRREHLGQPGADSLPHEREPAAVAAMSACHRELLVAELDPGLRVGVGRVRRGQAERHVHVVHVRGKRASEDGHQEARVDGVHHEVDAREPGRAPPPRAASDASMLRDRMARGIADRVRHPADPIEVVVGKHHLLQPWPTGAQARDRLSDGADSDQQDLHEISVLAMVVISSLSRTALKTGGPPHEDRPPSRIGARSHRPSAPGRGRSRATRATPLRAR